MRFQKSTAAAVVWITPGFAQNSTDPSFSKVNGRLSHEGKIAESALDPMVRVQKQGVNSKLETGESLFAADAPPHVEIAEDHAIDRPQTGTGLVRSHQRGCAPLKSIPARNELVFRKSLNQTQPKYP